MPLHSLSLWVTQCCLSRCRPVMSCPVLYCVVLCSGVVFYVVLWRCPNVCCWQSFVRPALPLCTTTTTAHHLLSVSMCLVQNNISFMYIASDRGIVLVITSVWVCRRSKWRTAPKAMSYKAEATFWKNKASNKWHLGEVYGCHSSILSVFATESPVGMTLLTSVKNVHASTVRWFCSQWV